MTNDMTLIINTAPKFKGVHAVYIFINPAFPEIIKIGRTNGSINKRMQDLSSATGVPMPFECFYAAEVANCVEIEAKMHRIFAQYRIDPKKEFFTVDPYTAKEVLSLAAIRDITPPKVAALTAMQNAKLGHIWDLYNLPIGAELIYVRDQTKKVKLVAKKKLEYDGRIWSLTALANHLMEQLGQGKTVCGEREFLYEGEMLQARRVREQDEDPSMVNDQDVSEAPMIATDETATDPAAIMH